MIQYDDKKTKVIESWERGNHINKMEVPADEYVKFLEEKVEQLRRKIKSLQKQITAQNNHASRSYYDQQDYLPYEEDKRE